MAFDKPLGRHTVAEARSDERAVGAIAEATGLTLERVLHALTSARGATQIRNVFRNEWPSTATALESRNVAFARDLDLREELQIITGATRHLISKRLNAAHGRQLLRNLFWDWWPDAERILVRRDEIATTSREVPAAEPIVSADGKLQVTKGTVLSERYIVRHQLGEGGFGTTWEAHDRLTEMDIVLKIPHEEDGGAIRNELRQAFRVLHPNICQAFPERDDETGRPFLVMQHGGEDLIQRLERGGNRPFSLTLAVQVLVSVADALDYLHDKSILHLDVTPKNILIDSEDVVRLTDFGASSQARAGTTASGQRTRLATSLHSFNHCYAAPEQFDGIGRGRSDQYGLFLVFCSLLEGRARTKPAAYHDFRDFDLLTSAQNEIVRRALSTDPDRRFESCGEPARALADDMAHVPKHVLASDIERLRDDLVRRVDLEQQRISSGTARLGGALKLGRGLERLLQASLLWLASEQAFDALVALKEADPHATTLDRSTAGNLVKALAARMADRPLPYSGVGPFLTDISEKRDSIVWAFINARNDVVHGRRSADAIVPYATRLAELLRQPA